MALRQFSAYYQWQVSGQGRTLRYHRSMNQWMMSCGERYTQGGRKAAVVVQSPCRFAISSISVSTNKLSRRTFFFSRQFVVYVGRRKKSRIQIAFDRDIRTEVCTESPGQALTLFSEDGPSFIGGALSEIPVTRLFSLFSYCNVTEQALSLKGFNFIGNSLI